MKPDVRTYKHGPLRALGTRVNALCCEIAGALLSRSRHCERSEAIQNPSAERPWIASLRSQ
jgi:hypothetical protein